MSATKTKGKAARATKKGRGFLSHGTLIAVEAMLVMGVLKDVIFDLLRKSGHPNWLKVVLVMGTTVGLFGGLFFVIERLTARGVAATHGAIRRGPFALPTLLVHAAILFLLFLLYARMLGLKVL